MAEVSPHIKAAVKQRILRDLNPSLGVIYLKSGLAVVIGGVLSLAICGQFGVSVTHSAGQINNLLHHHTAGLGCAILCGIIFSVAPAIVLRLISSATQFRAITRKSFHAPLIWLVSIGGFLAYHGDHGKEIFEFVLWCMAAFAMFETVARLIEAGSKRFIREKITWG